MTTDETLRQELQDMSRQLARTECERVEALNQRDEARRVLSEQADALGAARRKMVDAIAERVMALVRVEEHRIGSVKLADVFIGDEWMTTRQFGNEVVHVERIKQALNHAIRFDQPDTDEPDTGAPEQAWLDAGRGRNGTHWYGGTWEAVDPEMPHNAGAVRYIRHDVHDRRGLDTKGARRYWLPNSETGKNEPWVRESELLESIRRTRAALQVLERNRFIHEYPGSYRALCLECEATYSFDVDEGTGKHTYTGECYDDCALQRVLEQGEGDKP
jgi:hypothetical protein